jgi:hypothetical protein
VYQKYQQPGHYARESPLPPDTCMYYHTRDHDIEECPTLLGKNQEKRNQNNHNVHWISIEVVGHYNCLINFKQPSET